MPGNRMVDTLGHVVKTEITNFHQYIILLKLRKQKGKKFMDWEKFTEKFLLGILPTLIDITVNILKSIFNKFVK